MSLLRWYKLDEGTGTNAADSGSDAKAGTLTGGPTWQTGQIGPYCVQLDGVNDNIITAAGVPAITNQLTIAAWVNITAAGSFPMIVSIKNDAGSTGFEFRLNDTNGKPQLDFALTAGGSGGVIANTSVVNAGWKHLVAVYNGVDSRIYSNGSLDCTPDASTTDTILFTGANALRIGCRSVANPTSFDFPLTGKVDDVRVYNNALSAAEVTALFAFTGVSVVGSSGANLRLGLGL